MQKKLSPKIPFIHIRCGRILPAAVSCLCETPHLPDSEKQRFKPLLPGSTQTPSYVTISGKYVDHHGLRKDVTYTVYLGENNYNDFFLMRNHHYQNNITIKGLTNDSTGDDDVTGISIDHRVDVEIDAFAFHVERETQIDCHFEVRPMDSGMSYTKKIVNKLGEGTLTLLDDPHTAADFLSGTSATQFNVSESTRSLFSTVNSEPVNQSRSTVNRIRCVYDPVGLSND